MCSIKQLSPTFLVVCLLTFNTAVKSATSQNATKAAPAIPTAEVLLTPSQQWRTERQELLRIREILKRYIHTEFQIAEAEQEAKRSQKQGSPLAVASDAGLMTMPDEGKKMTFNAPPPTPMRFVQRRSNAQSGGGPLEPLAALENMMSQAINSVGNANLQYRNDNMGLPSIHKAGALLDALQSPEARSMSQSLTQAVATGRLPLASLIDVASALAPQQTQEVRNSFTSQNTPHIEETSPPVTAIASRTVTPVIPEDDYAGTTASLASTVKSSADAQNYNDPSSISSDGPIDGGL